MNSHIAKYVEKANYIINEIAAALEYPNNTDVALHSLKAVLHALRSKLTVEDNLKLIAQLPMILKGIYVDGWTLNPQPVKIRHILEFIDEVRYYGGYVWNQHFPDEAVSLDTIATIFQVLQNHISEGEVLHIASVLPIEIRRIWNNPVSSRMFD